MKRYTTSRTRKQILVKSCDGEGRKLRHYPRTEKGMASAQRAIDRLTADGYTYCDPDAYDTHRTSHEVH